MMKIIMPSSRIKCWILQLPHKTLTNLHTSAPETITLTDVQAMMENIWPTEPILQVPNSPLGLGRGFKVSYTHGLRLQSLPYWPGLLEPMGQIVEFVNHPNQKVERLLENWLFSLLWNYVNLMSFDQFTDSYCVICSPDYYNQVIAPLQKDKQWNN